MNKREWLRTFMLVVLITVAVVYIYWLRTGYQSGLLDILR